MHVHGDVARAPSTGASPQRRWSDGVVAALLALANFTAFTVMLLHLISRYQHDHNDVGTNVSFMLGSDVSTPLIGWVWLLILLNGIVLCTWRRARSAGVGLLVTAAAIAPPSWSGWCGRWPPSGRGDAEGPRQGVAREVRWGVLLCQNSLTGRISTTG